MPAIPLGPPLKRDARVNHETAMAPELSNAVEVAVLSPHAVAREFL